MGGRAAPGLSLGLRISEMSLPTKLRPAISGSSRATGLLCPPGPQAALLPDLPGPLAFHPTPFLTGPWFVCLSREKSMATTEAGPLVNPLTFSGTCMEHVLTKQPSEG